MPKKKKIHHKMKKAIPQKSQPKIVERKIKYREVMYVGIADQAIRVGMITKNQYKFVKDGFNMPIPTQVDERDYPGLISEKGKGCARRNPEALFISKTDWDLEIEQAKQVNR